MAGRHEDVSFRVFVDESEIGVYAATDLEFGSQMEHEGTRYQGRTTPMYDATYNGDRGSATLELPPE